MLDERTETARDRPQGAVGPQERELAAPRGAIGSRAPQRSGTHFQNGKAGGLAHQLTWPGFDRSLVTLNAGGLSCS